VLTLKQQETFQFIKNYMLTHGIAPTEAEIAEGIGISSRGVVHRYVTALAKAGYIEMTPSRKRNIRLVEAGANDDLFLPIIGTIAAGSPLETFDTQKNLNIPMNVLGTNRFILEVKGDSMLGDNICDGDLIICERRERLRGRDIAVVLVDNQEATLKRLVRNHREHTITLVPSNPRHTPMTFAEERLQIQGIYVGLLRLHDAPLL
jgi:repressor LexA